MLESTSPTDYPGVDYPNAVDAIKLLIDEADGLTVPEMLEAVIELENMILLIDITPYRYPQKRKKINEFVLNHLAK